MQEDIQGILDLFRQFRELDFSEAWEKWAEVKAGLSEAFALLSGLPALVSEAFSGFLTSINTIFLESSDLFDAIWYIISFGVFRDIFQI